MTYLAILPRCAKYASMDRRDNFPVLVVCPTDTAERNWHQAGQEFARPPLLLTTTLARLKQGKVFGQNVWSYYGREETIYPAYPGNNDSRASGSPLAAPRGGPAVGSA